MRVVSRTTVIK